MKSREGNIELTCIYIHPGTDNETIHTRLERINRRNNKKIIIGDLNAHNSSWILGNENQAGKIVDEFTKENNLSVIKKKAHPTRIGNSEQKSGSPDIVICDRDTKKSITDWRLVMDVNSDHTPIIFKLEKVEKSKIRHRNKHWVIKKCDIGLLERELDTRLENFSFI